MSNPKKVKLPNGTQLWEVRIREGGRGTREIRRRFTTRVDADEFLSATMLEKRRRGRGLYVVGSFLDTTFEIEAKRWLESLLLRASVSWRHSCKVTINDFCSRYGNLTPDKITPEFMRKWQSVLKQRTGKKPNSFWSNATVNRYTEAICAVLNFSATNKRIPYNPLADFKKLPRNTNEMLFWTQEEASSFLCWANQKYINPAIADIKHGRQFYIAYLVAINTGLRAGEIWGLKPYDLVTSNNNEGALLQIRRQYSDREKQFTNLKSESLSQISKNRQAPCPIILEQELKRHIAHNNIENDQSIFQNSSGRPIAHRFFNARFERDLKSWGGRKIRFHDLRHTAGTLMLASGVNIKTVQDVLGHKRLQTTERYLHVLGGSIRHASLIHSVEPTETVPKLQLVTSV